MPVLIVMLLPAAPLLVAGLLTEEVTLLGLCGLKAGYNACVYGLSHWLERREGVT